MPTAKEITKIDKPLIVPIVSKFPDDVFAEVFIKLNKNLQKYLVEKNKRLKFAN